MARGDLTLPGSTAIKAVGRLRSFQRKSAMLFRDRREAGEVLASKLLVYAHRPDVQVLALPRGGVPVAFEVARGLRAPLDVFLVRKLGVPGRQELAMGAIASSGVVVLGDMVDALGISEEELARIVAKERTEMVRQERLFRGERPVPEVRSRTVILVDDGLATGSSMRAAVIALRKREPRRIVVAVPVGAPQTCAELLSDADECVCVETPEPFYGVGIWYGDFAQTSDEEVRDLLARAEEFAPAAGMSGSPPARQ